MNRVILTCLTFLMAITTANAQGAYDLFQKSFNNGTSTTARVAAMGGAFTSLGADASSITINPAGLALYRTSDMSVTPSLNLSSTETATNTDISKVNSDKFNLNGLNFILNLASSDTKLVRGLTFGFSYNQTATNGYTSRAVGSDTEYSIADYYAAILSESGNISPNSIFKTDNKDFTPYENYGTGYWGAIGAFNNGLIAGTEDAPYTYMPDQRSFYLGDRFNQIKDSEFKNRTDVYSVSMGIQLGSAISLGMSIGIENYTAKYYDIYSEEVYTSNIGDYNGINQWEGRTVSGTSFDFKIGAIAELMPGLRLGAAYHAPKTTIVEDVYYLDQEVYYTGEQPYFTDSAVSVASYKMQSASKVTTGASYVIKNIGIISVDWDRTWYNKMKLDGIVTNEVANNYQATNTIKVGAEVHIIGGFFARGGFATSSSPIISDSNKNYEAFTNITGGLGYNNGKIYIDLAYIHSSINHLPYSLYNSTQSFIAETKERNNIFTLTAGFRF